MGKKEEDYIKCPSKGCPYYMPKEYDRCDTCLVVEYREILSWGSYDTLDHLGMQLLYEAEKVYAAIRAAERREKNVVKNQNCTK